LKYALAIVAPIVGAPSETFIRRHMQDLLPGRTVVLASTASRPTGGDWSLDCPSLIFDEGTGHRRPLGRLVSSLSRRRSNRLDLAKRFLTERGVQVVLAEYLDFSLRWLDLSRQLGIAFFAHAHGYDVSARLLDPEWRQAYLRYNNGDGVITPSALSRRRLVELGLDRRKVHSIPSGVDVPSEPQSARRPTQDGPIRCLAVGRFITKKAPIVTLEAFRRALKESPSLRLDFVGDGELWPAARQFVDALGLADAVRLHRAQPSCEVRRLLAQADIFLQHSITDPDTGDEEGLPVAILEAMAQAVPVVATRHAGIPEAVVDGETGFLVDEGDCAAMSERIVTLAGHAALRRNFGVGGWERAKQFFSWERERASLLEVLRVDELNNR
jgi:colanic acid/amylovoran biosynthesis glycosyltransferase